jgi:uncharacterized membrane protein
MLVLKKYHIVRVVLNLTHMISACLWLGAVVCIGLMLYLNYDSSSTDELLAYNLGIRCLDYYMVGPSVIVCFLSGLFLCMSANLRLMGCRWVATKWIGTWVASLFGALWLSPWLHQLEKLCLQHRFTVFATPRYYQLYWLDCANIMVQVGLLIYLLLLSIQKPCEGYKNCVNCRERFGFRNELVPEPVQPPEN